MLFPSLTIETTLQVKDKTRLDATGSFSPDEEIIDVLIKPEATGTFISVFNEDSDKWYIEWAYLTAEIKTVEVKIVSAGGDRTRAYAINVITEEDDRLFSNDALLFPYEPQLKDYLPVGKSTFIYAHRAAQDKILAYLDEQRIWKNSGERLTKEDIVDKLEFQRYSVFQTLLIIFESTQVSVSDIFQEKRLEYEVEMKSARSRAALRLDLNDDGENDVIIDLFTTRMIRR